MHCKAVYDTLNRMEISSWQQELRECFSNPRELIRDLGLPADSLQPGNGEQLTFPLKVTASYLQRIEKNRPDDPLLRQILPVQEEETRKQGFVTDPVGELDAQVMPGLLHKYHGRVLLIATGACAIHCRYCFRQHFPYADSKPSRQNWHAALAYIKADPSISEVILSGGDPLMLADSKLSRLFEELANIPHLKRLRIHSRIPVVLPSRLTGSFLKLFQDFPLQAVMILHTNHGNEIDDSVKEALADLKSTGMPLLNQSVLLKGVNDSGQLLAELNEKLFECGVLPYYLHMLDAVQGASHFVVEDDRARQIMHELRLVLPGYLVPRLVREKAGAPYKVPLL